MRESIGCAIIFAVMAFIPGLLLSLMLDKVTLIDRIFLGSMPAGFTFVAVLLLCWRDRSVWSREFNSVQRNLLAEADVSDADCLLACPELDPQLVLQTRQVLGEFFDVPPTRIHPGTDLKKRLKWDRLEPSISGFVGSRMLQLNHVVRTLFSIQTEEVADLADLCEAIQRMLGEEENQTGNIES